MKHTIKQGETNGDQAGSSMPNNIYQISNVIVCYTLAFQMFSSLILFITINIIIFRNIM